MKKISQGHKILTISLIVGIIVLLFIFKYEQLRSEFLEGMTGIESYDEDDD